jgi:sulfatase modifying factor 1
MASLMRSIAYALVCSSFLLLAGCGDRKPPAPAANEPAANSLAPALPEARAAATTSTPALSAQPPSNSDEVHVAGGTVEVDDVRVDVSAFSIDRTEVTVEAFAACVESKRCEKPATDSPLCNWKKRKTHRQHPVNCVTHGQAVAYCSSVNKRLPSAAEWRLAAGGPEARTYPWGDEHPSNLWIEGAPKGEPGPARHRLCWSGDGTDTKGNYAAATCSVHEFPDGDTPTGIADLAGNVAEWTSEKHQLPMGETEYLLLGGGFSYDPLGRLEVRVSDSTPMSPDHASPDVGFRCVK